MQHSSFMNTTGSLVDVLYGGLVVLDTAHPAEMFWINVSASCPADNDPWSGLTTGTLTAVHTIWFTPSVHPQMYFLIH